MDTTTEQTTQKQETGPRVKNLLELYETVKGARSNFESYWQTLHDYFYIEASDVSTTSYPGTELTSDFLYDATTLDAADKLASGFMSYLTPPTSKWFSLNHSNQRLRQDKKVQGFFEDAAAEVHLTFNRSNFYDQMFGNFKSSGVYGTSCMMEEDDVEQDGARFYSMPIKQVCLVEDSRGRVCAYFIEFEFTATQAAEKWGRENLSDKMKEELSSDKQSIEKHPFLLYIAKRSRRDIKKSDKKNMPIEGLWIDVGSKMSIEESGYNEFPAFCHRFDKRPFIPWGFSPAMKALPFARILNTIAKTNLRAMMKITDPPIAVPDNAFIMPFSGNPRAVNYYNKAKMEGKDIFAFGNFGDPATGMNATEYYAQKVRTIMYYDVFLAFDNLTKQMNNPEVMERINEKMTMLGPAVGRYISEMINPAVIRTLGILYRAGRLPPIPDELMMDPSYEIDCISQLAQAQRRSELNSLMSGLSLVGQIAPLVPDALDKVNVDKVIDKAWEIIGASPKVLRDDEEVEAIREAKGRMAQQQMSMNMMEQGANVVKTGSEVDKNMAAATKEGKK
jgi:hypothetical protein